MLGILKVRFHRPTKSWYTTDKSFLCQYCDRLESAGDNENITLRCTSSFYHTSIEKNVYRCSNFKSGLIQDVLPTVGTTAVIMITCVILTIGFWKFLDLAFGT